MKQFFICLFAIISWTIQSQELEIAGIVKDIDTQTALENVTVQLYDTDSSFVEGCVTNKSGRFVLQKGIRGNMYLILSFVGYKQNIIQLENVQQNLKLGNLFLEKSEEQLAEIVVSSSRVINKVNRQIIFPSTLQTEASSTAFELLEKMRLPDLLINTIQNTIASLNNGEVQLRINNVKASVQDILAIHATQVVKVEYLDMPGARYGEGVSSVVNFVTRRTNSGFSGGLSLNNAITTGNGNDNFFLKYNNGASEFSLNYNFSYRKYGDKYSDTYQELVMADDNLRILNKEGIDSPFKKRVHNLSLTYNYTKKETSTFNVKLSNSWDTSPFSNTIQLIRESGKDDVKAYTGVRDKTLTPVLDVYYELNLPNEQTLMANVVATYINSDYLRNYAERDPVSMAVQGQEYNYSVTGDKYSVIAELIYDNYLTENLLWSSGINYKQSYLENHYLGSTGDVTTSMDDSNLYVFTELDGQYKKLGFNIGIGLSRQYFKESNHKYNYYTVRPKVSLSYPIAKDLFVRYSFSINPVLPVLSRISDVSQWQNAYEVIVGNPQLKPYRAYANNLSLRYSTGRFSLQLMGYYQYNPKPIMMDVVRRADAGENTYFSYTYANQKSFEHIQGRLYMQYGLIKDILDLSAFGGVNHYINKGNEYEHKYTGLFGGVSLDGMYKNFILSASVYSGITNMFAETRNISSASADVALSYRLKKNMRVGIGMANPFFKNGEKSGQKLISDIAYKETWNYIRDVGNMLYVTFSWNFSIGRKYEAGNTQLFNSDNMDSGIVK